MCGSKDVESYIGFCPPPMAGTIYIPWMVRGQMGFCIPYTHTSLSGVVWDNLKMQYCCHQLEEDTEPE